MNGRLRQAFAAMAILAVLGVQAVSTGSSVSASPTPNFSIGDASVVEGDVGDRGMKVPVTLSNASASDQTVTYTIAAGSASAGTDYQQPNGSKTLVMKAGTVSAAISVNVLGDALVEGTETITVTLSSPTGGYVIGRATGTATVLDDDPSSGLKVSIGDVTMVEGDLGLKPYIMQFGVSLNTRPLSNVTVDVATADGSAKIDQNDYTTAIGHLTFKPGVYKQIVSVKVKGDNNNENDEAFTVHLENAIGATLGRSIATGTILNDENTTATSLSSSPNPSTTGESVTLTATVTSSAANTPGTVSFYDSLTLLGTAPVVGGVAQLATSSLSDGVHSLVASYAGPHPFHPSTSSPHSHTVGGAAEVCEDGTCGWGANEFGQVGDGTTVDRNLPVSVEGANSPMAPGGRHTLSIRGGELWTWGDNEFGQLGDGTTTDQLDPIRIGSGTDWEQVAAGDGHSLAIKTNGTLWAWGSNLFGQLGDGTTIDKHVPTQVGTATDWQRISAGGTHSLAVKGIPAAALFGWGDNNHGQIGAGLVDNLTAPTQIGVLAGWTDIDAGGDHSLGLRGDGELYAWGYNASGQLGDGSTTERTAPVRIGTETIWRDVAAGGAHSLALKTDPLDPDTGFPDLFAWGENEDGQLGDTTTADRLAPVPIAVGAHEFGTVDAGRAHSVTSDADGGYQTWGDNAYGQLGNGNFTDAHAPVTRDCCGVSELVAGGDHTFAKFPG